MGMSKLLNIAYKRVKIVSSGLVIILCPLLLISHSGDTEGGRNQKQVLVQDLVIGQESGDEKYVFAGIESIGLDDKENIYILDKKNLRVQVFNGAGKYINSAILTKGQGPLEVSAIAAMTVTGKGIICILDSNGKKIVTVDTINNVKKSFILQYRAINIVRLSDNKIMIIGFFKNHIFHVYDSEGTYKESFGDPFSVPKRYSQYANFAQIRMPIRADYSPSENVLFIVNNYEYKIAIYKETNLKTIKSYKSDFFKPLEIISHGEGRIGMIFPWVSVMQCNKRIYVSLDDYNEKTPNRIEVYENDKHEGSINIIGFVYAIDKGGRIYCSEAIDVPKMVRYSVKQ